MFLAVFVENWFTAIRLVAQGRIHEKSFAG